MIFLIDNLMDEQKCYEWLLEYFYNSQLCCASCASTHYHANQSSRRPVIQYK